MPQLASHGSACCGARCIFSFGIVNADSKAQLDNCVESEKRRRPKGFVECIITDSQVMNWHEELVKRGFERTIRFYNSGNSWCNVYVLVNGQNNMVGGSDDPVKKLEAKAKKPAKKEAATPVASPFSQSKTAAPSPSSRQGAINASPRARREAEDLGINLATITGSGPNGRILSRDVQRAAR